MSSSYFARASLARPRAPAPLGPLGLFFPFRHGIDNAGCAALCFQGCLSLSSGAEIPPARGERIALRIANRGGTRGWRIRKRGVNARRKRSAGNTCSSHPACLWPGYFTGRYAHNLSARRFFKATRPLKLSSGR